MIDADYYRSNSHEAVRAANLPQKLIYVLLR